MNEPVTTLAAFKRFLKDGGTITLRSFGPAGEEMPHKYRDVPRKAVKVQTVSAMFEGGSWLTFGKASNWSFDGPIATVSFDDGWRMTYEMGEPI